MNNLVSYLAFCKRSVSWKAARKTAHEKIEERRETGVHLFHAPSLSLLYFAPPFPRAAPQRTVRLEEAVSCPDLTLFGRGRSWFQIMSQQIDKQSFAYIIKPSCNFVYKRSSDRCFSYIKPALSNKLCLQMSNYLCPCKASYVTATTEDNICFYLVRFRFILKVLTTSIHIVSEFCFERKTNNNFVLNRQHQTKRSQIPLRANIPLSCHFSFSL